MGPIVINRHFQVSLSWRWRRGRRWTTQHVVYAASGYACVSQEQYPDFCLGDLISTATDLAMDQAAGNAATGFDTESPDWGGWSNCDVEELCRVVQIERGQN